MKHLRFHIHYVGRHWARIIVAKVMRRLWGFVTLETIDGIGIVDMSESRNVDSRFRVDTVAALSLIRSVDPRRYRRVQREVRFITNCEGIVWAAYDRSCRNCEVDYGRSPAESEDREWHLRAYAATLVHEATHGAILSRYIGYTPALRARIEKLCVTEANRFVMRFDTPERDWSESLLCDFDEKDWEPSWNSSRLQRAKALWQRFREARRRRQK